MAIEITKAEIEELSGRCYRSPVEFARIFVPDWFPTKMPWVHRGILALLKGRADFLLDFGTEQWKDEEAAWTPADLDKILTNFIDEHSGDPIFELVVDGNHIEIKINAKNSVVVMMPRGFSKTTLINLNTLHETCYADTDFFLYLSEASDHAERQLETVKGELESNELLILVFGNKVPPRQSSLRWSAGYIETAGEKSVQIGALGTGGKIRGYSKRAKRPKMLVFDDLQDEKSVESEAERKKARSWFFRAARPAKAKGGRDIMIGTLLHKESVISVAMGSRAFSAVRFGAIDKQGAPLWAFMMDLAQIEEMRLEAAENGELTGFYMEYLSQFHDEEASVFPENKLIYINKGIHLFVAGAQALDPAISDKRQADDAAMAVVMTDAVGSKHVVDYFGQKGMDPIEMLEKYFEHHIKWLAHLPTENQRHGIEAIAFQAALLPIMRTKMVEKSKIYGQRAYFEIIPITHGKTQKDARIKAILKTLIWSGVLTFEEKWPRLHGQFVDFGKGGKKDGPDAVAMATALLDPYVLLGLGENEQETAAAVLARMANDNAPPLEQVLGADFRSAP